MTDALNRERIRALADRIELLEHVPDSCTAVTEDSWIVGFDMMDYRYDCGSPSCIAGWTVTLYPRESDGLLGDHEAAAEILGLSEEQAFRLFVMYGSDAKLETATPKMAAATLRRLADTGVVRWSEADA